MRFEHFVAKHLLQGTNGQSLSGPFVRISTAAVALSLCIMLITVSIIAGFRDEISGKAYGMGGHLQITNYDANASFESTPIYSDLDCLDSVRALPEVVRLQAFATKAGIIKTGTDIEGVVLKGVGTDYDWQFYNEHLVGGSVFEPNDSTTSNSTLISKIMADKLHLGVGDTYDVFFVQTPPRYRRFTVAGIYSTQLTEFDRIFALCDIKHIQRISGWQPNQVTGFEVFVNDTRNLDELRWRVDDVAGTIFMEDYSKLRVMSLPDKYPGIFDWMNLQRLNASVLIVLMLVVAGINMISGLLIIIIERTGVVGLLKAMGALNRSVRLIFLLQAARIMLRGLLVGNAIGLGLCLLQRHTGLVRLNEEFYFLSQVPISIVPWHVLLLNVVAFSVGIAMLVLPSMVVSRISPDKTLKFN
ncbi:MAG: ABC transporter permease [Bacteroidales bacterium]|nr:ABC transporter permease [Bacteroidales bacterium]